MTCLVPQETFGKHVSKPTLTKLPAGLFEDFISDGALCHIMEVAFKTKVEQQWRRFDFNSPSRLDRGIDLFMSIHRELTLSKMWLPPRVLINSTVGHTLMAELVDIVKRHQVRGRGLGGGAREGRYVGEAPGRRRHAEQPAEGGVVGRSWGGTREEEEDMGGGGGGGPREEGDRI